MFERFLNTISTQKIPHIRVEGKDTITKIDYVGKIQWRINTLVNLHDLLGYEIRSDSLEIWDNKKFLGRGFIGDIAGITVDIDRVMDEQAVYETGLENEPFEPGLKGLMIRGTSIDTAVKFESKKKKSEYLPCVVLAGKTKIESVIFKKLRKAGDAMIDDEKSCRYKIAEQTRIEITMPNGVSGLGYVCDPSGVTIAIQRRIKILGKEKDSKSPEVIVNFSGRIGKLATSEKLSSLLFVLSGREKLVIMTIAFLLGNVIGVVLHI